MRCSVIARATGEPLAGSAPRADVWILVEHPDGWGDAPIARAGHGVRVVMARGPRTDVAEDGFRVWIAQGGAARGGAGIPDGGATGGPTGGLRVGRVADPGEVAAWDLAAVAQGSHRDWGSPVEGPLLAVCANGRRDRCCGHAGGRLAAALWAGPDRDRIVTCTHLGGHRFAPTALLLPWGVLHGRLDLASARALLASADDGWTPTGTLRGFSAHDAPAQVAEAHVRRVTGYRGLAPLPIALFGEPHLGALDARASLPDGRSLTMSLVRTSAHQVVSCGRPAGPVVRWSVAG